MDVYYFDTHQKLIGVINEEHIIDAHLTKKINQGSTMSIEIVSRMALPEDARYMLIRDPDGDEYLMFTIQNRKYKQETVTYTTMEYAWEQLTNRGLVKDYRPSGKSVRSVLQDILINYSADNDNWEIRKCNIDTSVNTNFYYLTRTECLTKLVEVIGKGELEFHVDFDGNKIVKTYIDFMAEIGSSNVSYWFEWEKNLIEVTNTSDESEIYASIVPRGKGELVSEGQDGSPDGYGRRIGIEDISWSKSNGDPLDKKKGLDTLTDHEVSNKYGRSYRLVIFEDIDDPKQLIRAAYRELKKHNHKQVQYSASVLDGQTVQLGDHVVIRKSVGREIAYETRVFMIEYDLLRPQNSRISLGDDLTQDSLSKQISNIGKTIDSVANNSNWGLQNTDGSKTFYSDKEPANAKEGDLWFKQLPNGEVEIWRFENGSWQMVLNQNIGDDIQKQVDDALKSAKEYSDQLNQKTNENIGQLEKTVNSGLAEIQPKIDAAKKDAIDTSQQKVDALNQQVNKDLQTVQPRIDKAKQEAMQDASQKISKVEIKTDTITSIVNNPSTGLSATRVQLDAAIQQEIKDRKTGDTNTLTQGKDFTTSQITNSEKGLKSTINQTADGIMANVGRQNLIIDSSLIEKMSWWKATDWNGKPNSASKGWYWAGLTLDQGIYSLGINNTTETTGYAFALSQPITINNGAKQLYANVDVRVQKIGAGSSDYLIVYVVFMGQAGNVLSQVSLSGTYQRTTNGKWESHAKAIDIPEGAVQAHMKYQLRGNANAYVSRPYIGFGPLDVGSYIPGPVSNSSTTLALFDDRITSTVTGLEGKISNVTQKADSLTSIVNNPTTGLSATRTQLDSAIQQEIKDRKSGDTNTLTQSKDFTTSQIKSSESGLKSTISQTADGIMLDVSKANLVIDSSLTESLKWWTPESVNGISSSKKFYYAMLTAFKSIPSAGINMTADTNINIAALNSQIVSIPGGCKKLYAKADIFVNKIGTDGALGFVVGWYDKNKTYISYDTVSDTIKKVMPWTEFGQVVDVPANAKFVSISYTAVGVINAYISRPYLGTTPLSDGAYIPGPVSNTDTFLSLFNENFGLGIKDNVGNIISGINGDTSGLAITGKKVAINGDTTVNGDFWTKNVNAVKVNASNITAGTIDANKVNLVHLNANQITTGTLQGININVNKTLEIATGGLIKWNTDAVIRGYSDNPSYWKGVGDGKFSVVNITEKGSIKMDTESLITLEGQLKAPENTSENYLGKMWTHSTGPASNSAFGRNRISSTGIELQIYEKKPLDGVDVSYVTSINANGINMGTAYVRPRISLSALSGTISGRRVRLGGDVANPLNFYNQMMLSYFGQDGNTPPRFQIESYDGNTPTVSYSANMYMASTGAIFKTSSKRAKKTNIRHDFTLEKANALVDLQPATWHDKAELERTDDAPLVPVRHFGMVAEELEQAGLSQLVEYDEDGNVMSISYDRLAIALIPAIRSLRERVGELEYKLNKIKEN